MRVEVNGYAVIISKKHNFIYIAVPKTGTHTIHNAFLKLDDEAIFVEGKNKDRKDRVNQSLYKHIKGSSLKVEIENYDTYFKFGFVRNPWDVVVSWVHYGGHSMDEGWATPTNLKKFPKYYWDSQCEWLFAGDRCLVDFIGRFENLQEDFNIVCDKIGIPRQELPCRNPTKHKHYTEYYDDETRQIVAEKYAKDIEYFGYEFGE